MIKKNKLNNNGYMLIEIVLASVIAFGLAYFMLELTLKLKNKNDDLVVETLMSTDNAIISNAIMKYLEENNGIFTCSSNIKVDNKKVYIGPSDDNKKEFVTEINKYASIDMTMCYDSNTFIMYNEGSTTYVTKKINIPLYITNQKDKRFYIDLYYDMT